MFCFAFLYLIFAGPGAWSLNALRGGQQGARAFAKHTKA